MMMRCAVAMVLCAISVAGGPVALGEDAPAKAGVFRDLSPKEARDLAIGEGKILLVRWTATWCGPCKRMDATTWPHPDVVRWVGEHAVAISADLDTQRRGAAIQKVNAVPTLIAFRDGKEVARVVGYRDAAGLMAWLGSVAGGADDLGRMEPEQAAQDGHVVDQSELDARMFESRILVARLSRQREDHDRAAESYIWMWRNFDKRSPISAITRIDLAEQMRTLGAEHAPSRAAFARLRDDLAPRIVPGKSFSAEALEEWVVLNLRVLDASDEIIRWAEAVIIPPAMGEIRIDPFRIARGALVELGRWDLAAKVTIDPAAQSRGLVSWGEQYRRSLKVGGIDDPTAMEAALGAMREDLSQLHALALVQGKESEAAVIVTEAIAFDGSDEMRVALVRAALRAGCAREMHRGVLSACTVPNPVTAMQLDAALAKPATE